MRIAIAGGHGIGKSALVAFLDKRAMGTCTHSKVVITSNTNTQLATKTPRNWPSGVGWRLTATWDGQSYVDYGQRRKQRENMAHGLDPVV